MGSRDSALRALAMVQPDQVKLGLGQRELSQRFLRELARLVVLARELEKVEIDPGEIDALAPVVQDVIDAVTFEGYREVNDRGQDIFTRLDRCRASLEAVAAAHRLVLAGQGEDLRLVPIVTAKDLRVEGALERLASKYEQIVQVVSPKTLKEAAATRAEIEGAREQMRRLVAEAAKDASQLKVGSYHTFFAETAEQHREAAKRWLWTAATLASITFLAAVSSVWLAYNVPSQDPVATSIAKGVAIAVLATATVWSGLNYRSHRHNGVVNEHRSDALGSFDAFWNAANTESAKDTVLTQASGAIYLPQPSGFTGKDTGSDAAGYGALAGLLARRD